MSVPLITTLLLTVFLRCILLSVFFASGSGAWPLTLLTGFRKTQALGLNDWMSKIRYSAKLYTYNITMHKNMYLAVNLTLRCSSMALARFMSCFCFAVNSFPSARRRSFLSLSFCFLRSFLSCSNLFSSSICLN